MSLSGSGSAAAGCSRQRGAALLALLALFALVGLAFLVAQLNTTPLQLARDQATAAALRDAKDALLGRAASDDNRPGSLPCPALDDNGVSPLFAGNDCPSYIGRLPWKTLDSGDLRDGSGERLWYALAPALRDDDSAEPVNMQTLPELQLDGSPAIAAIVFAPGEPLSGQNGRPGDTVTDYLDGSNADGDFVFVSGPSSPAFNDRVMAISRDEVFRVVARRVLGTVRESREAADCLTPPPPGCGLQPYRLVVGALPWADSDGDGVGEASTTAGGLPWNDLGFKPTGWLARNRWLQLVRYDRLSSDCARIWVDMAQPPSVSLSVASTGASCP